MKKQTKEHSSSINAAWTDHERYDNETHVNIPSEEAVLAAKQWVENNEL